MENNKCDCSKCEHWDECEIGLIVHNPIKRACFGVNETGKYDYEADVWEEHIIKKVDKVAQCTLMEHKGYLMGIESDAERSGGFGSTGV